MNDVPEFDRVYDYTQYSHDKTVNVIPEKDFTRLVRDTFETMCDTIVNTYGPYGAPSLITSNTGSNATTKDGYNVIQRLKFGNTYKHMVYCILKDISTKVNRKVGDGTTSCILLANEMYKRFVDICQTPDEKRNLFEYLKTIETELKKIDFSKDEMVQPLTKERFDKLITVSGNFDTELTEALMKAFDPQFDSNGVISSCKTVIPFTEIDSGREEESRHGYEIDYLPGDFRLNVDMETADSINLQVPTEMKIIIYDHKFTRQDWHNLVQDYDYETPMVLLVRSLNKDFLDTDLREYLTKRRMQGKKNTIFFTMYTGHDRYVLEDLCAILKTNPHSVITTGPIDHSTIITAKMSVYQENCLCFYDLEPPRDYILRLKDEMNKRPDLSFGEINVYNRRIKDLSLRSNETKLTIYCDSDMEAAFLGDKVDDAIRIIESATKTGVVPNLLQYGARKIIQIGDAHKEIPDDVIGALYNSIRELFNMIYRSKHGATLDTMNAASEIIEELDEKYLSFDIITEDFVSIDELCTSAQYDVEVIVAALSIINYLLTSRSLIFDAALMPSQGDSGQYKIR